MRKPSRALVAYQLLFGAAFVGLGVLVAGGACARFDQYAVDHWMSRVTAPPVHTSLWATLRPFPSGGSASEVAFNVWTFPASPIVSVLVLSACCIVLARRGWWRAAAAWVLAWAIVNGLELVGKSLVHRPALHTVAHGVRVQVTSFRSSFPSGHTARALLVASMITAVWPRAGRPAAAWVTATCVVLVVSGDHTPSDIVGGILAALLVLTWVPWRPRFLWQE